VPDVVVARYNIRAAIGPDLAPLMAALIDPFAEAGRPGDPRRASCGPSRIDHLLARGLRAVAIEVRREATGASDHDPVVARFEV